MDFPDYKFVEFCHTSYTYRKPPKIIEVNEVGQYRAQYTNKPAWTSHFRFTEDFPGYCQEKGSVSDYGGQCYSSHLWMDVDVKDTDDPEKIKVKALGKALELAQKLLNVLMREYDYPADGLWCYFTGSKGFCIGMAMEVFGLEPSQDFNDKCKYLVKKIAGDLIEIDEDVYDKTRLWRIPNTPNDLSGLYKIPLTVNEILECQDIQQIIDMAHGPREMKLEHIDHDEIAGELAHLMDDYQVEAEKLGGISPKLSETPGKKKEKHDYAAILSGKLEGTSRTGNLTILTGHWQQKKIPLDEAIAMGQAWDKGNVPPLDTDPAYKGQYPNGKVAGTVEDMYRRYQQGEEVESTPAFELPEAIRATDLVAQPDEKIPMIIGKGLIPVGGYTILGGYAKEGKTTLGLQMSTCASTGTDFLTFPVEKPHRVLYLHLENSDILVKGIVKDLIAGWGSTIEPEKLFILNGQGFCIDNIDDRRQLRERIADIDLCVIDPISLAMKKDQNSYEVVRELLLIIKKIGEDTNTTFLLIHNLRKPGIGKFEAIHGLTGSSAWGNIAESIIGLEPWSSDTRREYKRLSLKLRTHPEPDEDICLYRDPARNIFCLQNEEPPKIRTANVMKIVADAQPVTHSALVMTIKEEYRVSESTAKRYINKAVKAKQIKKDSVGKYNIL